MKKVIAVLVLIMCVLAVPGCQKSVVIKSGGELSIPVKKISETVTFYPAIVNNVYMEVLAARASDGTIRTAYNTCFICYDTGRGYFLQENADLICQQCKRHFAINEIGFMPPGGCQPIAILDDNKTVSSDTISISFETLSQNTKWFLNWKTR